MQSTIETRSDTESIRVDVGRMREKLEELNRRRGELAFLVRKDPAKQSELEQVRAKIQATKEELRELELALEASVQRDKKAINQKRRSGKFHADFP